MILKCGARDCNFLTKELEASWASCSITANMNMFNWSQELVGKMANRNSQHPANQVRFLHGYNGWGVGYPRGQLAQMNVAMVLGWGVGREQLGIRHWLSVANYP